MSKFLLRGLEAPNNKRPPIRNQAAGITIAPTDGHFHDLWVSQGVMTNGSENPLSGGPMFMGLEAGNLQEDCAFPRSLRCEAEARRKALARGRAVVR